MKERMLNGYRALYKPNHPTAYTSENWKGYVYEHRYLMEVYLDRPLREGEVVHHLDGDKLNNRFSNLIVLTDHGSHAKLHHWIDSGAKMSPSYVPSEKDENLYRDETKENTFCKQCGATLQFKQTDYCSRECYKQGSRKTERPDKEDLVKMIQDMGYSAVARLYNVSDNAVRKWVKNHGLCPKTFKEISTNDTSIL